MDQPEALAEIAGHLKAAHTDLAADNARASLAAVDRLKAELRNFIRAEGLFQGVGGICNAAALLAEIAEEESQLEGDDWEKAAEACDTCAEACDLEYAEPEAVEYSGTNHDLTEDQRLDDPRHGQARELNRVIA